MTAEDVDRLERIIEDVRRRYAGDARVAIFEVAATESDAGLRLDGVTTEAAALEELLELARAGGPEPVIDRVRRLPDAGAGTPTHALVRAAVAPLYAEPRLSAPHVSQYVLGHRLHLLDRAG
ncbi:MAG: hypothetical protein ACRELV_04675, partial [Longimicrobiales bacterium]